MPNQSEWLERVTLAQVEESRRAAKVCNLAYEQPFDRGIQRELSWFRPAYQSYDVVPVSSTDAQYLWVQDGTGISIFITGITARSQFDAIRNSAAIRPSLSNAFGLSGIYYRFADRISRRILQGGTYLEVPVRIYGHSFGGATAIALACICKELLRTPNIRVITFGAPKAGTNRTVEVLAGVPVLQWRNLGDFITTFPQDQRRFEVSGVVRRIVGPEVLAQWQEYRDIGQCVVTQLNGTVREETVAIPQQVSVTTIDLFNLVFPLDPLIRLVHAMPAYEEMLLNLEARKVQQDMDYAAILPPPSRPAGYNPDKDLFRRGVPPLIEAFGLPEIRRQIEVIEGFTVEEVASLREPEPVLLPTQNVIVATRQQGEPMAVDPKQFRVKVRKLAKGQYALIWIGRTIAKEGALSTARATAKRMNAVLAITPNIDTIRAAAWQQSLADFFQAGQGFARPLTVA